MLLLLFILIFSPLTKAEEDVKNPDTLIHASIGNENSLDPHYAWDSASYQAVFNVYETLIRFKGDSLDEFDPVLAAEVPGEDNGLISDDGLTYTFPIREDIHFSNGDKLTPEDVEYSFERAMVLDRSSGPMWMLFEPLLGVKSLNELSEKVVGVEDAKELSAEESKKVYEKIDQVVETDGNNVVFHLDQSYPPFLSILSGVWSSVMNEEWAIEQGAWDGKADTLAEYHNPTKEEDPLYDRTMGTGPFILEDWENGEHVILNKNEDYWRENANFEKVIIKNVDEFSTRRLMLKRKDADIIYTPREQLSQVKDMKNVDVLEGLPTLQTTSMTYTWDIDMKGNDNVGSGKLDGNGIPSDFFNDVHVRKAFAYSFDYETFLEEILEGSADRMRGPFLKGVPAFDEDSPVYEYDLEKAEEHFKKAFDGELWEKGFKMNFAYNSGNSTRKIANDLLKESIESLNPKFNIEVRGINWSSYLDQELNNKLPLAIPGWYADFPDPHNFAQAFMSSDGRMASQRGENYSEWARENEIDKLIDEALETQEMSERVEIYQEMNEIAYENAIDLFIAQPQTHQVKGDWVDNFAYNAMYAVIDYYRLDK